MGRKKMPKVDVYMISDITIDEIIDKHIELITTPIEILEDVSVLSCYDNITPKFITKIKSTPSKSVIYHKILFILHLIISRCRAAKDNKIQLHSGRLQDIIGRDYSYILKTLEFMNIISISDVWNIGEHCRFITLLNWNIKKETIPNVKVVEYLNRWYTLTQEAKSAYSNNEVNIVIENGQVRILLDGDSQISEQEKIFREQYQESLSKLNMKVDIDTANKYINSLFTSYNNHRYNYYSYCINEFDNDKLLIQSIDKQNRIYHFLTSLPKSLKPLFNIKYQLDIANSHPLLICNLLIKKYNIDPNILSIIYNIKIKEEDNVGIIHNITKEFDNKLNINMLDIPLDVLIYIYICSNGMLWDYFTEMFDDYTRDEVKTKVFREILYPIRDYTEHTKFGQKFIELFPSVHLMIKEVKKHKNLPLLMMRFESKIMRDILSRCYEQGLKVVSIHDAIVVLDTPENNMKKEDLILQYINQAYNKYALAPTIHYEEFPFSV